MVFTTLQFQLHFYSFQLSLNHRANGCSCFQAYRDLPQLGLNILFLEGRNADVLDVLLVGQQRRLQNVLEAEARPLEVEREAGDGLGTVLGIS
jgi:hypothetical protein